MKLFLLLLTVLFSLNSFSISTGEVFYNEFSDYYETAPYEIDYCHKNHAKLLNFLKDKGANLEEIQVIIIQQDKTKPRLEPQNGLYDNSYAWHVVLLYNHVIYDLNAKYSPEGINVEDYFSYVLGFDTDMSNVLVRSYEGEMFYNFFFDDYGYMKSYNPNEFIQDFLSQNALSPLIQASMLKWF